MLRTEVLQTRSAKLIAAVVAVLMLVLFQVAVQAKPAHAWEVRISITGAGKVEETTPANLVGPNCFSPSTTPTGTLGKTCIAGTPTGPYGNLWDVDYRATPASGYTFARWESDGTSRTAVICDRSDPPATSSTYTGSICKFRTVDNMQTRAVFVDNQLPPTPSITGMSPSSGVTNGAMTFFLSTTSDPTFKGFQCSIDSQTAWQSCSSGPTFTASEGTHTLYVRSIDHSNNISLGTATRQWTVDQTAPDTTLDPNVGPTPNTATQSNDLVFQFSSSEPTGATFECNLTGPGLTNTSFFPCNASPGTSPNTWTKSYPNLKDGTYTFKVRAKDQAGNVDTSPESRTWTINNTPTVLVNSLTPVKLATGVARNTNVSATFSEEMAAISLRNPDNTSTTFKLQMFNKKTKKWKTIPATITLSNGNTTATLDPFGATEGSTETLLAANKKFRGFITTGAKDADGNPLASNFIWTFNTGG